MGTAKLQNDQHIRFAIDMETTLMSGDYAKIYELDPPSKYYAYFRERLVDTAQGAMCKSIKLAYDSISVTRLKNMLHLPNTDVGEYIKEQGLDWRVNGPSVEIT